jgi:hypothetical protein
MTIVNYDSRVINKLEASLTDDARVVIYDHHLCIIQAIGPVLKKRYGSLKNGLEVSYCVCLD